MAGLFNYWKPEGSEGRPIPTFTIVTTGTESVDGENSQPNANLAGG
jgi:hypothetical protein